MSESDNETPTAAAEEADATSMPLGARIHRLQRIVADLERQDIELEDAMRLFEEGVTHLRAAETLVARTELRIERLLETRSGLEVQQVDEPE